ncbi:MAG TPA: TIGR04222 domain-containing membrane protein [Planctomycetota bacterium]|nr:TIGR04222 domain-containing membrane protein [Planctomycetota bacterium]
MPLLNLSGPEFLLYYAVFLGASILGGILLRMLAHRVFGRTSTQSNDSELALHPIEIAYLEGKSELAVESALLSLMQRELVQVTGSGSAATVKTVAGKAPPGDLHTVEKLLLGTIQKGESAKQDGEGVPLRELAAIKLVPFDFESPQLTAAYLPGVNRFQIACLAALPLLITLMIGLSKIMVGLSRGKPVSNLVVLCIFTVIAALVFLLTSPKLSYDVVRYIKVLKARNAALKSSAATAPAQLAPMDVALAAGLFGGSIFMIGPYREVRESFHPPSSSSSCSGSGSSCSSGSSCGGGGGGGGGCGGCSSS